MKAKDVVLQLYSALPALTDKFTEQALIDSITAAGLVATATTSSKHNLTTGDLATITGAFAPVAIESMVRVDSILTVVTSSDHDLSEGYQEQVEITEANEAEFNGSFKLLSVPNRRTFEVEVVDSGPTSSTGSPVLLDGSAFGYNGLFPITVLTPLTFSYALRGAVGGSARGGNIKASIGYRITAAATPERAAAAYTKQNDNKYWIFVVLGDVSASKDRNIENDAVAAQTGNTAWKQQLIQPFTVFVFMPSSKDIAGRLQRDDAEDIALILFQSLLGTKFDSGLASKALYQTTFSSHGTREYEPAVYVHGYDFATIADLTFGDTIGEPFNVAFRDIGLDIALDIMTKDSERLTVDVDLDDQSL